MYAPTSKRCLPFRWATSATTSLASAGISHHNRASSKTASHPRCAPPKLTATQPLVRERPTTPRQNSWSLSTNPLPSRGSVFVEAGAGHGKASPATRVPTSARLARPLHTHVCSNACRIRMRPASAPCLRIYRMIYNTNRNEERDRPREAPCFHQARPARWTTGRYRQTD